MIRRQGFLQPDAVTRVLDDHVAGREDLSRQLWGLLAFTLWYERHVEGVRRDASLESVAGMKVWVDLTASAHPLVFRPLVELLRGAGSRGRDHDARLRADDSADRVARHDRDRDRPPRRPLVDRQGAPAALAAAGTAALGEGTRLRPRARARLARADDDGAPPRHPELDDLRLRVGVAAAPARLPRGDARRRARLDPARAARDLRREAAEAAAVPGAEGGVLPLGLRARPLGARRTGASTRRACSSCSARRPTCRSTTATRTRSSRRRSSTSAGSTTCTRS